MQKLGLELIVKIAREKINLRFIGHVRKQRATAAQNLGRRLLGNQRRVRGILRAPDLGAAIAVNHLWHYYQPDVGTPFIEPNMIENRALEQFDRRAHSVIAVRLADGVEDRRAVH